jgi:hypothetical protein
VVEAGQRPFTVVMNNKDYIHMSDIVVRNADISGIYISSTIMNNTGIVISNVEAYAT